MQSYASEAPKGSLKEEGNGGSFIGKACWILQKESKLTMK